MRTRAKAAIGLWIAAKTDMNTRLAAGLCLCLLGTPSIARASDDGYDANRNFVTGGLVTGGYGAPTLRASTLAGDGVMLAGGEGGWILAHSLVLGAAGYGTLTNVVAPRSLQSSLGDARLGMGYGGIRAAAIFADDWRVHGVFGVLVGGGSAWSEDARSTVRRIDGFLVIEPELNLEVNITHNVRAALGGGYRFAANADAPGFTPRRLGGPVALFTVRLGEL